MLIIITNITPTTTVTKTNINKYYNNNINNIFNNLLLLILANTFGQQITGVILRNCFKSIFKQLRLNNENC